MFSTSVSICFDVQGGIIWNKALLGALPYLFLYLVGAS